MYAFQPELVEKFPTQFAAVLALNDWAKDHRPTERPTDDAAGELILITYARSSKTYQAAVMLAGSGYGAQAGMLNRSLFEDMAVAHWVKLNPEEAPELYERHRQHTLGELREKYAEYGREEEVERWDALSEEERADLSNEFSRKHHWTKRNLYELVKSIEDEFKDENVDRRMLWETFDIVHRFNNLILHHSFFGLGLAGTRGDGKVSFDVGPSDAHIQGALYGAFFNYGHTTSLVHTGKELDDLNALWSEHIQAFTTLRTIARDEEE
jgi:Family of unknown function (DUF5677)